MKPTPTAEEIAELARAHAASAPEEVLAMAISRFGDGLTVAFSGAEDVLLVDMAARLSPGVRVFCLDTGRLHPETYRYLDVVRTRLSIQLDVLSPNGASVEAFVKQKGLFSFYEDGHTECCAVRKVEPLRRHLADFCAWATGQRKDQSPNTRADVPVIQLDRGNAAPGSTLIKINPLATWSSAEVWRAIRERDLPINELHSRGYVSIGCEPCTRAILPGQHEREGRWWWEEATKKECGLHRPEDG